MTNPILRTAPRLPRIIAGLVGAALLTPVTAASASPDVAATERFESAFAAYGDPAEPNPPASAVDIDTIDPADSDEPAGETIGQGVASYYGARFAGHRTASGERFDPADFTAAHRTLPFGSKVRVTNASNGRSVIVRINDRGPFARDRLIDLSRSAAERIGIVGPGHGTVQIALLDG